MTGVQTCALPIFSLPYGTSGVYFTSSSTSGDAISIWGESGIASLVGVSSGYTSGTPISADMVISGQTIAGMTLIPGSYTFTIPSDTVVLNIAGTSVPQPSTWVLLLNGVAALGFSSYRRSRKS